MVLSCQHFKKELRSLKAYIYDYFILCLNYLIILTVIFQKLSGSNMFEVSIFMDL